jgi:hypothetical protein
MASVLLCEDERLARQVAVKRLHADSPVDVEQRFTREAKLGASLNHPNLVSVFDTATDDEGVLIVMEYVEGEPLSRMLRRGPLRPEEVSAMVRDLGDALDHAHAQGIVHRDVKPSNVLIREDGLTKLADLGIATASDGTKITRSGTVLGTAAYMAPEQLDGRGAGPASDVYALAAVSFEALSGKRPRQGRTPMEIAHRIATEGAPDLRDVWPSAPKAAARVLQRAMAREPEDRPASAGEFAHELCEALEESPPEKTRKARRFLRRGGSAGAAGAAPVGAAAAGAAAAAADTPARSAAGAAPQASDAPARAAAAPASAARTPPATAPAKPVSPRPAASPPASPRRAASPSPAAASAAPTSSGSGRAGAGTPGRARAGRRRPNATALVLAAIIIALAAATVVGAVLSSGDDDSSPSSRADRAPAQQKPDANKKKQEPQAKQQPQAKKEPKQEQPAAAPAPTSNEQPSDTASSDPARGAALNDEAFVLMRQGNYAGAVPKLQEAVKLFPSETTDINYAYTLFNLGKSLRMVGRPDEAIPYLEQRLRWNDQTETVQHELDLARQQAG